MRGQFSADSTAEERSHSPVSSGQNLFNRASKIDLQPLLARDFELTGIEAELMQNGCMNISDVMPILDGVESQFVSCAVSNPALYTAAREEG